ncbi:putative AC transposase [Mycena venus]|uniref:Putative AC transposase n=1 Tax=Mycena venus TaxID=2733690 RepID=A0A8H6YFZ2_9AGAR|nr:putative AC transposase [Mycena venus]
MAPRTRKNAEQPVEPPPASHDSPPVAGRIRRGGRSGPPAPSALTTAQNASSSEPDRGFAGLSSTQPVAGRTPATTGTHRDVINTGQQTGEGAAGWTHQLQFPPQTPARRMAKELASRLAQHTEMASPGPPVRDRLHANSDVEDSSESDSDEFPLTVRQRVPRVPALRIGSDSDDSTVPPSAAPVPAIHQAAETTTGVQQPATRGTGRRRRARTVNTQANIVPAGDDDCVFVDPTEIVKTDKSADSKYFFGRRSLDNGFKCRLCPLTTRRLHLQNAPGHPEEYFTAVEQYGFANKLPAELARQVAENRALSLNRISFSMNTFMEQLVKVFVANDLLIHLIDSREFRDLLLLLRDSLAEKDIPHRTKLTKLVVEAWVKYYAELKVTLNAAIGKISFTADIWSSKGLHPYLAITAHWLGPRGDDPQVLLRQTLLAFRRIRGAHSGQRIACIVFNILEDAGIVRNVGHFTLDNASNNGTFMLHFTSLLRDIGIRDFDEKQNYIRCFAHVINLCSQAVIRVMEKDDADAEHSDPDTDPATESTDDEEPVPVGMRATRYTRKAGPIHRARKTVAFVRKSGQRRDELQSIITHGNTHSLWKEVTMGEEGTLIESPMNLASVMVIADVKTRWDSVFYMLRRLRYLQQI